MARELKDKSGNIVRRNGEVVWVSDTASAVSKGVDVEKRLMWITGSTEAKDRDGDIIMVNGWDVKDFLKNPVFLWAHDYTGLPIGGIKRLIRRKEPRRVDFLVHFADLKDLWTFPQVVMELYADRKLNASSVGFIPIKHEPLEKDDKDDEMCYRPGRRFLRQALLELSGCPVPSNPEALADSFKGYKYIESLDEERRKRFLMMLIDGPSKPETEKEVREMMEHEYTEDKCEFVDELEPTQVFIENKIDSKIEVVVDGEEQTASKEDIHKEYEEYFKSLLILLADKWKDVPVVLDLDDSGNFVVRLYQQEGEEQKLGAVLNAKNREKLTTAMNNIKAVLDSAQSQESEEENPDEKYFEQLMSGPLPPTSRGKMGSDKSKQVSTQDKGKDKTEEKKDPLTEQQKQRLAMNLKEVREEFPGLFQGSKGGN